MTSTNIAADLQRIGLSQQELADELKVSRRAVADWVAGTFAPKPGVLEDLARIVAEHDAEVERLLEESRHGVVVIPAGPKPSGWYIAAGARVRALNPDAELDWQVRPYFLSQARKVMRQAGGNPARAWELAKWAQAAREAGEDQARGVLVSESGIVAAETRYKKGQFRGASYVVSTVEDLGLENMVVDMAVGQLSQHYGERFIHVKYGDVCQGAGKFAEKL